MTEKDPLSHQDTLFLSHLCREWEKAASAMSCQKTRVIRARFGVVLSKQGGALPQMITLFRLGLGGTLGRGDQYISWITLDDLIGAFYHILMTPTL